MCTYMCNHQATVSCDPASCRLDLVAFQELADSEALEKVWTTLARIYAVRTCTQKVISAYKCAKRFEKEQHCVQPTQGIVTSIACRQRLLEFLQICKELNNPTLRAVKSWQGKRGHWKCTVSEPTGRMYKVGDTDHSVFLLFLIQIFINRAWNTTAFCGKKM